MHFLLGPLSLKLAWNTSLHPENEMEYPFLEREKKLQLFLSQRKVKNSESHQEMRNQSCFRKKKIAKKHKINLAKMALKPPLHQLLRHCPLNQLYTVDSGWGQKQLLTLDKCHCWNNLKEKDIRNQTLQRMLPGVYEAYLAQKGIPYLENPVP